MLFETNYNSKDELIKNIDAELKKNGFVAYRGNIFIFDLVAGKEFSKNDSSQYHKNMVLIKNRFDRDKLEMPDVSKTNKPYFVLSTTSCKNLDNNYKPDGYFVDSLSTLLGILPEKKVYTPYFYKFLTEREDWDVSAEELYWDDARMEELYQDYLKEIDDTVDKLKDMKKAGKEDTPEFASFVVKLSDLAPELARSFKAS